MDGQKTLSPNQVLMTLLLPMLITVIGLRLYLHLVGINHVYIAGYIVRHLFSGALLVVIAGFLLAFEPQQQWLAITVRAALGIGSALVLDEIVFMVATEATKADYVSATSVIGSIAFNSIAAIAILLIYILHRK